MVLNTMGTLLIICDEMNDGYEVSHILFFLTSFFDNVL